ncbi:MAG: AI-2E family transporter [Bacteroidales bacterium]|nr:AI-2E family transporter [Bacteroidales bacterium]HOL97819.1 AI-2E family transporter [Bacteroidales bacterium]HOM35868.1 AI-2E family transporter [Bacteroidales bacterium]HPD23213.1 AI-2E family transporter [Bacteroidales bacterium]HRS99217.1 AI-2E family transporter [Bacteroidales bacterium]
MGKYQKYIVGLIGLVLLLLFTYYFSFIIKWILISAFIAMLGNPLVELLSSIHIGKIKFPKWLASILTILTFYLIIYLTISLLYPFMINQVNEIQSIDIETISEGLEKPIKNINDFVRSSPLFNQPDFDIEDFIIKRIEKIISFNSIGNMVNDLGSAIWNFLLSLFAISFISFFFLKDKDLFDKGVLAFVPEKYEEKTANVLATLRKLIARYLLGIILETFLMSILFFTGLYIIGVDFQLAIIIAVICGILNIIPYIGPWIGAFTAIILVTVDNIGLDFYSGILPYFYKITIVYAVAQLIDNIVFQPFIYSKSVKAHPLEIFLVIIIAGTLYGVPGMMLAIPGYTVLRVIAKEFLFQYKFIQKLTRNINYENSVKNEDI